MGAAVGLRFRVGLRTIGLIMAFGAGVLISALAFDLIEEAVNKATGHVAEALSSTSGLVARGWKRSSILGMWTLIALVSGVSSLAGYAAFKQASPDIVAFVLAFAAGAILTMLADTMMPGAYLHAGKLVGVMTTLGFATASLIDLLY